MPLYDCLCNQCNHGFEHFCKIAEMDAIKCPNCKGKAKILITNNHNQDWFKPHWNPNFDDSPVFVKTKRHFKELCLKYNVTSSALGDVRNIKEV